MYIIKVEMKDLFTGEVVSRDIDGSNFSIHYNGGMPSTEKQRQILLNWIEERANQQHDTYLELVSWSICHPIKKAA